MDGAAEEIGRASPGALGPKRQTERSEHLARVRRRLLPFLGLVRQQIEGVALGVGVLLLIAGFHLILVAIDVERSGGPDDGEG